MNNLILKNAVTKIIQITDTHLFENDDLELFGVKRNKKFEKVIEKIIDEDISDTDLILFTGDISQDTPPRSAHFLFISTF